MGGKRWLIMPTIDAGFSFKAWPVVAGGPTDALSKGKDERVQDGCHPGEEERRHRPGQAVPAHGQGNRHNVALCVSR